MLEKIATSCKWLLVVATVLGFRPADKEATSLRLVIRPVFGTQSLVLKKQAYQTMHHDSAYIDAFKFYLSDLSVSYQQGKVMKHAVSDHLVNAADTASLCISWESVQPGQLGRLSFYVGVDSLANVSGAMGGDLDPSKAMYWAWNTGYINAKLEGRSPVCKTLHHAFEFHIGGYLEPYNTRRKVTLDLSHYTIEAGRQNTIIIEADALQWLGQADLGQLNSVVMPSPEAMMLADHYATMFRAAR